MVVINWPEGILEKLSVWFWFKITPVDATTSLLSSTTSKLLGDILGIFILDDWILVIFAVPCIVTVEVPLPNVTLLEAILDVVLLTIKEDPVLNVLDVVSTENPVESKVMSLPLDPIVVELSLSKTKLFKPL